MSQEVNTGPQERNRRDCYPPMVDADASIYVDREPPEEVLPIIDPPPPGEAPPQFIPDDSPPDA